MSGALGTVCTWRAAQPLFGDPLGGVVGMGCAATLALVVTLAQPEVGALLAGGGHGVASVPSERDLATAVPHGVEAGRNVGTVWPGDRLGTLARRFQ